MGKGTLPIIALHIECRFNKNSLLRSYYLAFFAGCFFFLHDVKQIYADIKFLMSVTGLHNVLWQSKIMFESPKEKLAKICVTISIELQNMIPINN